MIDLYVLLKHLDADDKDGIVTYHGVTGDQVVAETWEQASYENWYHNAFLDSPSDTWVQFSPVQEDECGVCDQCLDEEEKETVQ